MSFIRSRENGGDNEDYTNICAFEFLPNIRLSLHMITIEENFNIKQLLHERTAFAN